MKSVIIAGCAIGAAIVLQHTDGTQHTYIQPPLKPITQTFVPKHPVFTPAEQTEVAPVGGTPILSVPPDPDNFYKNKGMVLR